MSQENPIEKIPFSIFLESTPPGNLYPIDGFGTISQSSYYVELRKPVLQLYCDSKSCDDIHYFDQSGITGERKHDDVYRLFFTYTCRHCKQTRIEFAIVGYYDEKEGIHYLQKVGEFPPFGPKTPNRVFKIVGKDRETFLKGRRSEAQGLGIGAFAYYRRVVENQRDRIISEIIDVLKVQNENPETIALFERAKSETQFSKSVDMVKNAVPDTLKIHGQNPLTLLHSALSEGVHNLSDDECLEIAQSIRLLLLEFSNKVDAVLKDSAELKGAVSILLGRGKKPA